MTGPAPLLFDEALIARRTVRADPELKRFVGERLAAEVLERLLPVNRTFASVLVTGPVAAEAAGALTASGQIRRMVLAAEEPVDCVVSLIELQTLNDPVGRLIGLSRRLKPDGLIIACLAGGGTLSELRQAWLRAESEITGGASPRVAPMADLRDMAGLLQRAGLALPVADLDRTTLRYADPLKLMREVKALGFANPLLGRSRVPVTRGLMLRAVQAYQEIAGDGDGRVRASIGLLWLTAWTPHESQQRPLKPGSAKMRLADALNPAAGEAPGIKKEPVHRSDRPKSREETPKKGI
jgi:hypothetical protein